MTFLLLSMVLVAATFFVVRPAVATGPRLTFLHFDGRGVLIVFLAVVMLALFTGVTFALALILAALVKELGHALGDRLAGGANPRLRLVPLPDRRGAAGSDASRLFGGLMGPALGLAPMTAAFAASEWLAPFAPDLALALRAFALATGALNLLVLLPLWPLPGGQILMLCTGGRFAARPGLAAATPAAFLLGLALTLHAAFLFLLAAGSLAATALRPPERAPSACALTAGARWLGLAAYGAALAAYALAGGWALRLVTLPF